MFQSTNKLQYPRRKNFLNNLNQLFVQQHIKLPQKVIEQKFTPIFLRSNSATNARSQKKQNIINDPSQKRKLLSSQGRQVFTKKVLSQHAKTASLVINSGSVSPQKARKQKMKALLSLGNMRKTLSNNRKVLTSQNYRYRTVTTGQQRAKTAQKPLKNKQLEHMLNFQSSQLPPQNYKLTQQQMKYSSVQLSRNNYQPNNNQHHKQKSSQNFYDYRPTIQKQTKNYLKKGSSINKSVLNTIIKLKLSKNSHQQNNLEKDIKNEEIINMIKVYKGTAIINANEKDRIIQYVPDSNYKKNQNHPLIVGWENQTEQFNIQQS